MIDEEDAQMVYVEDKPDIQALSQHYESTVNDNGYFFDQCVRNREERRNRWDGKAWDHRKHGPAAFPWDGASDQEVHVIDKRVTDCVALSMQALHRSHTKALPMKMESMPRATAAGAFAKWMRTSGYIRNFDTEHEKAVNHFFEKGLMISYVGWEEKTQTYKQEFTLEEIAAQSPELAQMIEDGESDDEIAAMFIQQWPKLKPANAKKALRQLRASGRAELYVSRKTQMGSYPLVKACAPDTEVFFPAWCMDPQESPYVFWRRLYTVQQIEAKVTNEGWDRDWADEVIECYRGIGVEDVQYTGDWRDSGAEYNSGTHAKDLILVVHAYQRLVDDDGSEGIYCTTFNPYYTGQRKDVPAMAKRELLNGYDRYPFVVTRASADTDRMYDLQAMPEKLRGAQRQVKVERDSRIDRNAMATLPPMTGPPGKRPSETGPGRYVPVSRPGQYSFLEIPGQIQGSVEIEQATIKMADGIAGLDPEDPLTPARQQFFVTKTLQHACEVSKLAYTCFQRFGPDQIFFNVTGVPDPITFENVEDDEFQFTMTFDTLSTDPETMKARAEQMGSLMGMDVAGRIDKGRFIEFLAYTIDPAFAQHILLPAEENQQKLMKAVTEDLTKIYSGVAVGAQPNGAEFALQIIGQWAQQPDISEALQTNEALQERLETYVKQYQMQIDQAENAQIGKLGTAPATFQGSNISAA